MSDPVSAALEKAACAICICEGECFETRHGMMHGPCEKQIDKALKAIAGFHRALKDADLIKLLAAERNPHHGWRDTLADAVLAAAKEERE
jgi:hypothetical protein